MKSIGGFFELEIVEGNSLYHDNAIKLSTGRACLNYILKTRKPSKVYIPFYCCNALIEPIILNDIEYEFYSIDKQLELKILPKLKVTEIIIYINFFGIKEKYLNTLLNFFGDKLVIDNTHSFFTKGYKTKNGSFSSARKYFGVPDGAFLYMDEPEKYKINIKRNQNISVNHNVNRLLGLQEKAYVEYLEYEKSLNSDIEEISILSEKILSTINYTEVRKTRNDNFDFFRNEFDKLNQLTIDKSVTDCFCYPLLLEKPIEKEKLYAEKIFVPNLWLDTLSRNEKKDYDIECKLSLELLPLPIDHRYSTKDLHRVSDALKKIING